MFIKFKKYIYISRMLSEQAVLNKFHQDNLLKHILAAEGKVRCYEKVKNHFRRRQASL